MSKPPVFQKGNYEKVDCGDFINGVIEEVQEEPEHEFKYKDKVTVFHGIRFKFKLEGYEYPHYSRWNKFNYGDKSNLYNKYLLSLVEGAKPDMNDFDIQQLKGIEVRVLWGEKGDFQHVEVVRPLKGKIVPKIEPQELTEHDDDDHGAVESEEDSIPF